MLLMFDIFQEMAPFYLSGWLLAHVFLPSFLIIFLMFVGSIVISKMPSLILGNGVLYLLFFPC